MKRVLIAIAVAACGPTLATPTSNGAKTDGSEGAVCGWNHHSRDRDHPVTACATGLQCCYPCGIDGCDSVCEAVAACPDDIP